MISMIAAMSENRVIGKQGKLPWHIPEDLKFFKTKTMGHAVIMGRKTYESVGKPLPGRTNIVVTRQKNFQAPGCTMVATVEEAIKKAGADPEIFIVGGGEIYKLALPLADKLYITQIATRIDGDAFFPELSDSDWKLIEDRPSVDLKTNLKYRFLTYVRN